MSDFKYELIKIGSHHPGLRDDLAPLIRRLDREDHLGDPSYMSVEHLNQIVDQAKSLQEVIERTRPLEDWVESKITEAASNLDDVYSHLAYEKHADDDWEDHWDENPCEEGYKPVGMKTDENGNKVPNCVPKEE